MNGFDMFVLAVIGFTLIRGVFRGIIREVAGLLGAIGGFYAAQAYYLKLAGILSAWLADPLFCRISSFLLILIAVTAAANIFAVILRKLVSLALLGFADRLLGGAFGILKGLVFVSIIYYLSVSLLPDKGGRVMEGSVVAPVIRTCISTVMELVPRDAKSKVEKRLKSLPEKLNGCIPEAGRIEKGDSAPGKQKIGDNGSAR